MKQRISVDNLCSGLPLCFGEYMKIVKEMQFEDEPNYDCLLQLF